MRRYKRATEFFDLPVREICNRCGAERDCLDYNTPRFTEIAHTYGFGSKKDGDKYVSHICEACMDVFYDTFVIPPQIIESGVVGEDPGVPVVYEEGDNPIETEVVKFLEEGPKALQDVLSFSQDVLSFSSFSPPKHREFLRRMIEKGKIILDDNMELALP